MFFSKKPDADKSKRTFLNWYENHKGLYVDIEIAGEIFGGRHGEAPQLVREYEIIEPNVYKILFSTTEILIITNPILFQLGKYNELIVDKATQICIGWHYYGRPQAPENWCNEVYELKDNNFVEFNLYGPMSEHMAPHRNINLKHSFLRLI